MEFETEADSTDKSQPFEIKTEDITEHDEKPRQILYRERKFERPQTNARSRERVFMQCMWGKFFLTESNEQAPEYSRC